ncbi:rRNA maturation RNase YbeY [Sesbania bispinosa]|nr:rRNA maturation RNase YbeY [Sesbania bispinosa]
MATLIKILRVANRIVLKRHSFGPTQGLAFPYEPSKDVPPSPIAPLDGTVAVMNSRVLEIVLDWEAGWRHHAARDVRGALHCN